MHGAESGGCHTGNSAKGTGETALIGEAGCEADFRKRGIRIEQAFASGADVEAMDMLANAFADEAAKNARQVHGMDAGFPCELVEGEPAFVRGRVRGEGEYFGEQAFDREILRGLGSLYFTEEFHTEPEQRAAHQVISGRVQSGGAIREAFLPRGADLDFVKANAAGPISS